MHCTHSAFVVQPGRKQADRACFEGGQSPGSILPPQTLVARRALCHFHSSTKSNQEISLKNTGPIRLFPSLPQSPSNPLTFCSFGPDPASSEPSASTRSPWPSRQSIASLSAMPRCATSDRTRADAKETGQTVRACHGETPPAEAAAPRAGGHDGTRCPRPCGRPAQPPGAGKLVVHRLAHHAGDIARQRRTNRTQVAPVEQPDLVGGTTLDTGPRPSALSRRPHRILAWRRDPCPVARDPGGGRAQDPKVRRETW